MEALRLLRGMNIMRKTAVKSPTQNSDLFTAILIIIIFIALYVSSFLAIGLKKIKENWNEYRCSPMAMPFAGYLGYDAMETSNYGFKDGIKSQIVVLNPKSLNLISKIDNPLNK